MLARLLSRGGLFLGWDLIGRSASNPYGHYEDREIVRFHNALLENVGQNWQVAEEFVPILTNKDWETLFDLGNQRRKEFGLWGFKDPRACFFLHAWKHLFPELRLTAIYRDPVHSLDSLERRHAQQLFSGKGPAEVHKRLWGQADRTIKMWNAHNRALLRFCDKWPDDTHVISFSDLLSGRDVIKELKARWELELERVDPSAVVDPGLAAQQARGRVVYDEDALEDAQNILSRLRARSEEGKDE